MQPEHCVLLVEDNADDVRLTERALRKAGLSWPLRVAATGDAAVDYIQGTGAFTDRAANPIPTLILLDLKLPGLSGFEILQFVRRHPLLGRTIIVMLTSSGEASDIGRAYALGANSYLVKPIKSQELDSLMDRVKHYWLDANLPPPVFSPAT